MVNSYSLNKIENYSTTKDTSQHGLSEDFCKRACLNIHSIDYNFVDILNAECECQQEKLADDEVEEEDEDEEEEEKELEAKSNLK